MKENQVFILISPNLEKFGSSPRINKFVYLPHSPLGVKSVLQGETKVPMVQQYKKSAARC
jgi:hypothetical protein